MKTEREIKSELERLFNHRLRLRLERKLGHRCRNCVHSVETVHDLGDFGRQPCHTCSLGRARCTSGQCEMFECINTEASIRQELLDDISDPAVCGAKEPKIAALLWVLGNGDTNDKEIEA